MKKGIGNKLFYTCLFLVILCITGGRLSGEEGDSENGHTAGLPNPAAVYAASMGYKHKVRAGKGVVIFPDRTEADEWDFFRGKAGQQWSYCEQNGGRIENRTEDMGRWSAEYAVCVFVDGSECKEIDYFDGSCGPGI